MVRSARPAWGSHECTHNSNHHCRSGRSNCMRRSRHDNTHDRRMPKRAATGTFVSGAIVHRTTGRQSRRLGRLSVKPVLAVHRTGAYRCGEHYRYRPGLAPTLAKPDEPAGGGARPKWRHALYFGNSIARVVDHIHGQRYGHGVSSDVCAGFVYDALNAERTALQENIFTHALASSHRAAMTVERPSLSDVARRKPKFARRFEVAAVLRGSVRQLERAGFVK